MSIRLRRRRRVCSRCGQTGDQLEIHDWRVKRWRHLDLGANRCVIECELRRLRCRYCGVHLEAVPWAPPGSQHTRDLEDVVAWLAQQMAKTPITGMLRIGWDTVGRIVGRGVGDRADRSDGVRDSAMTSIPLAQHPGEAGPVERMVVGDHDTPSFAWADHGQIMSTAR